MGPLPSVRAGCDRLDLHVVDTTHRFPAKVRALQAHVSQTAHLGEGLEAMLRGWNGGVAAASGLPEGRLAEAFAVSRIN